jgi:F420-dependent hydroxymycolic acid dehydrogenase
MELQQASSSNAAPIHSLTERSLGFMLPHEQFMVPQLVEFAAAAERAGFDFVATSDHLQPWQANEGHSGLAWATMAAPGQKTNRILDGHDGNVPHISLQSRRRC